MRARILVVVAALATAAGAAAHGASAEPGAAKQRSAPPPDWQLRPLVAVERRFARTLAEAIAADVRREPPEGELYRIVLRWFDERDPGYFSVHALGVAERKRDPLARGDNAWYPLEWSNFDREFERTDRVAGLRRVKRAARRLAAHYRAQPRDASVNPDGWAPSHAIVATILRLPGALRRAGVPTHRAFSVSAAQFEGFGMRDVLRATAPRATIRALKRRGEWPAE